MIQCYKIAWDPFIRLPNFEQRTHKTICALMLKIYLRLARFGFFIITIPREITLGLKRR